MLKSIIIFLNVFLLSVSCLAAFDNDDDFRNYGFTVEKNARFNRAIWGYRLRYLNQRANTYAYLLGEIPQVRDSRAEMDKITFLFKARLYPVAPNTEDMRRVVNAYVKKSLGVTKEQKRQNGNVSTPAFVVSVRDNLSKKKEHRSFPIQYSKYSDIPPEPSQLDDKITLLFRDARLLPLNFFQNYDMEITFDYPNKIVSFNSNGNKVILKLDYMTVWQYYGLATLFSTVGYKRHSVIAFEFEFTNIKIARNISYIHDREKPKIFPRFRCEYYRELIKEKKDIDAMYSLGMNYYDGRGGAEKDYYQAFKWFKKAAMKEHVFAQYYVGLCHLYGWGTEQNNLLGWKWLKRSSKYFYDKAEVAAAQCVIDNVKKTTELNRAILLQSFLGPAFFQGNANAHFLQSYCAHYDVAKKRIDYLKGFKDAARLGHPKAFYYLGMHFAKNKRTLRTAFKCYFESAKRGFVPASVKLGMYYQLGHGTKQDDKKAFDCFEKAGGRNNVEGIFRLACCYFLGQGVEKNQKEALKLFKIAAKRYSPRALIALLLLQENNSQSSFFSGNDKAANDEFKSFKNSSYSARQAICYKYGIGVVKSREKALQYLQRSSRYNHWMAFELADSYEKSKYKSRDLYKAINLYKNAIAKGDKRAFYRLGKVYLELGNKFEMMLYYRQAAENGDAEAAFDLAKILVKEANPNNIKEQLKAFKLFEQAAKNGHIRASYDVGVCYYSGRGVTKSTQRAAEYWEQYEAAFMKQQNNSIHGLYWKTLPTQVPIKYDANGLPIKYHSQLENKTEILNYYKKY